MFSALWHCWYKLGLSERDNGPLKTKLKGKRREVPGPGDLPSGLSSMHPGVVPLAHHADKDLVRAPTEHAYN